MAGSGANAFRYDRDVELLALTAVKFNVEALSIIYTCYAVPEPPVSAIAAAVMQQRSQIAAKDLELGSKAVVVLLELREGLAPLIHELDAVLSRPEGGNSIAQSHAVKYRLRFAAHIDVLTSIPESFSSFDDGDLMTGADQPPGERIAGNAGAADQYLQHDRYLQIRIIVCLRQPSADGFRSSRNAALRVFEDSRIATPCESAARSYLCTF